jgi:hypothetical protein
MAWHHDQHSPAPAPPGQPGLHGGRANPSEQVRQPPHGDPPPDAGGGRARPARTTDPFGVSGPFSADRDPFETDRRPPPPRRQPPALTIAIASGLGGGYGLIAGIIAWRAPLNGTIPLLGVSVMVLLTTALAGGNTRTAAPACLAGFAVTLAATLMLAGWGSPVLDQIVRAAAVITAA